MLLLTNSFWLKDCIKWIVWRLSTSACYIIVDDWGEREWRFLWEYTRTGSNASQAARVAYGGTPISVRVKGHKKKVKLKPFLDRIDRIWDQWLVKEISQIEREVDAYLKRLRRRTHQNVWKARLDLTDSVNKVFGLLLNSSSWKLIFLYEVSSYNPQKIISTTSF